MQGKTRIKRGSPTHESLHHISSFIDNESVLLSVTPKDSIPRREPFTCIWGKRREFINKWAQLLQLSSIITRVNICSDEWSRAQTEISTAFFTHTSVSFARQFAQWTSHHWPPITWPEHWNQSVMSYFILVFYLWRELGSLSHATPLRKTPSDLGGRRTYATSVNSTAVYDMFLLYELQWLNTASLITTHSYIKIWLWLIEI